MTGGARLHPEAQSLLAELAGDPRPSSRELPLAEGRRNFRELFAPFAVLDSVAEIRDLEITTEGGTVGGRLYRPNGRDDLPVVVYFHGGGWVFGDVDTHDGLCRVLANAASSAVLSVDYRRAPEHPFPAAAEDAYAAVRWVESNAQRLGVDPRRLVVAGDSAGGNLAASTALRIRAEGGPSPRCQVLISPALDPALDSSSAAEFAEDPFLSLEEMRWYWDRYVPASTSRLSQYAVPAIETDLRGLPSAIVVTAELDLVRDEGEQFGRRLLDAGVCAVIHREPGMMHGFPVLAGRLTSGRQIIERIGTALRGVLVDGLPLAVAWHRASYYEGTQQ